MQWHESDAFWSLRYPFMFNEESFAAGAEEAVRLVQLAGLEPGATVLDAACGPGRHLLPLARAGFYVTGVDRTRSNLDECARRAREENLKVHLIEDDLRQFRTGGIDLAINMYTSFGYFEDPEEDERVLRNLHASLKKGGQLLLETKGKESVACNFVRREWKESGDCVLLFERTVKKAWSWLEVRQVFLYGGERREFIMSHRLYSASELTRLLEGCGFEQVEIYGNLDGQPYDERASSLVIVARA